MSFRFIDQLLSPSPPPRESRSRSVPPVMANSAPHSPHSFAMSSDRPPSLARQLRPTDDPELLQTMQQLLEDLAARMDRSVSRQISELEERIRASPPRSASRPSPIPRGRGARRIHGPAAAGRAASTGPRHGPLPPPKSHATPRRDPCQSPSPPATAPRPPLGHPRGEEARSPSLRPSLQSEPRHIKYIQQ
jgi:hypothetical protein